MAERVPTMLWISNYKTEDDPAGAVNFDDGCRVMYANGKTVEREWSMDGPRHHLIAVACLRERFPTVTWTL